MSPWRILLSPPEVGDSERALLLDAFDSGWVAPAGPDLTAFEDELAEFTGAAGVAALSSGTAALHLALLAVGVTAGDDVLVSDLTFGASAFAVTYVGARPCFVDCDAGTWQIDPDLVAQELADRAANGRLPAAVVSVDLYGAMADGPRLSAICAEYDVPLIEDAAESLGAAVGGVSAGRHGRVGVLSFNGNKIVTTGGGGALVTDDTELADRCRYLATQARQPVPWYEHTDVGFNYRLSNLSAAVGRGQLRSLRDRITQRQRVRRGYERHLGGPGVAFQRDVPDATSNSWLTTIALDPDQFGATAADVLDALSEERIEGRFGFKPMHLQPVFADAPVVGGAVSERLFATSVSLPSGARLSDDDVAEISEVVLAARD